MAHKPRIDFPGAWHHVMHRGARRAPIFRDDGVNRWSEKDARLTLWREALEEEGSSE
ncbi:MAG: hypothetical protein PHU25_19495 [Deltaproteobacteria bacterium]|nr:hypothetical protein [Deltaproteobacteria bacterium]